jgi:hypothetical protein
MLNIFYCKKELSIWKDLCCTIVYMCLIIIFLEVSQCVRDVTKLLLYTLVNDSQQ